MFSPATIEATINQNYSTINNDHTKVLEERYGARTYERINLVVRRAKGCWLYDGADNEYLDCLAAYSAANLGHHHPAVVNAAVEALQNCYGGVISNVVYNDALGLFLSKVSDFIPQLGKRFGASGNKALPKNGGVESVETAIKAMRYYGFKARGIEDGKQEIIVFDGSFHGRTITAVSFSKHTKNKKGFGTPSSGFASVPFGDIEAVSKNINANTCGILVEPIQGEGGVNVPPAGFMKGLRELCDMHDLLLICDEIQVGLGRTGKNFCFEHDDITPDGVVLGKALSGGLTPLSVFACNASLMDLVFSEGSDGSTYGGYPLACITGIAAIDVLTKEKIADKSAMQGQLLKTRLEVLAERSDRIKEVRGKGLFLGIEVSDGKAMTYCAELLKFGIVANDSNKKTIRITPPLIITDREIDFLMEGLESVLS